VLLVLQVQAQLVQQDPLERQVQMELTAQPEQLVQQALVKLEQQALQD
jgi:hypothetical protein